MPRPKKAPRDLNKLADDVAQALGQLNAAGYTEQVILIRDLLQAQGQSYVSASKVNRSVNNALAVKLRHAETIIKRNGLWELYEDNPEPEDEE